MIQFLTDTARAAVAARRPYGRDEDPHTIAYLTRGGSYVIASNGHQNDRPGLIDLMVIDVVGNVTPVRPTVNPDFLALVEEIAKGGK